MIRSRGHWLRCVGGAAALTVLAFALANAQSAAAVPKEVRDLTGRYAGHWATFTLDAQGHVVPQIAWSDSIRGENPTVSGERAYVTTTDALVFEGGRIPPATVTGTEGYALNADGTLGDYFVATMGQEYRMQRLGPATWAYVSAAQPAEFRALGPEKVLSAQHVLVKVITFEAGLETHNISRITTVRWKGADGEHTTQFVSLQGQHKRIPG